MNLTAALFIAISCAVLGTPQASCTSGVPPTESNAPRIQPTRSPDALDVVTTAQSVIAWDVQSGAILYEKNARARRPVASLTKLLSVLVIRQHVSPSTSIEIPRAAAVVQRLGAHVRLPVGQHVSAEELIGASLIASANDAVVTLAVASAGSEDAFVTMANEAALTLGLRDTKVANATGLSGGEQYSTAHDVRRLLTLVYQDPALGHYLDDAGGELATNEGVIRKYESTNDLLSTYLPIIAAKTGYTVEAGENVALLTRVASGPTIGIVILGSEQRFQDAKIVAEWVRRHYTWSR